MTFVDITHLRKDLYICTTDYISVSVLVRIQRARPLYIPKDILGSSMTCSRAVKQPIDGLPAIISDTAINQIGHRQGVMKLREANTAKVSLCVHVTFSMLTQGTQEYTSRSPKTPVLNKIVPAGNPHRVADQYF